MTIEQLKAKAFDLQAEHTRLVQKIAESDENKRALAIEDELAEIQNEINALEIQTAQ